MKKIIIAEDDEAIADVLSILFARAGFDVVVYPDGRSILNNSIEWPHLFLLDNRLSGVAGVDICRHIKDNEKGRHIPVIVMSATPHVAKQAAMAGADDFIEKPFASKELMSRVKELLGH